MRCTTTSNVGQPWKWEIASFSLISQPPLTMTVNCCTGVIFQERQSCSMFWKVKHVCSLCWENQMKTATQNMNEQQSIISLFVMSAKWQSDFDHKWKCFKNELHIQSKTKLLELSLSPPQKDSERNGSCDLLLRPSWRSEMGRTSWVIRITSFVPKHEIDLLWEKIAPPTLSNRRT